MVACSGEDDVVDGDEDKFDEVANGAHDQETDSACLKDLHVLSVVWLLALFKEVHAIGSEFLDLLSEGLGLLLLILASHLFCKLILLTLQYKILQL